MVCSYVEVVVVLAVLSLLWCSSSSDSYGGDGDSMSNNMSNSMSESGERDSNEVLSADQQTEVISV